MSTNHSKRRLRALQPSPFAKGGFRRAEHDSDRGLDKIYADICQRTDELRIEIAALSKTDPMRTIFQKLLELHTLQTENGFAETDLLHACLALVAEGYSLPMKIENEPPAGR